MTDTKKDQRPITLRMSQNIVPASDFKTAVDAFIDLLQSVASQVPSDTKVDWGIGVREGSAVINAYAQGANQEYIKTIGALITSGIQSLSAADGARPKQFDEKALQAARKLSKLQTDEATLTISTPWETVELTARVALSIKEALATKYTDYGTAEGTIQRLDVSLTDRLTVRLVDGLTGHALVLFLPDTETLDAFYNFIKNKQRVSVSGLTQYAAGGVPKSMQVERYEAFPDPSDLPTISEIVGILRGYDA